MVFFTCNQCGESLKKNRVEQHGRMCQTITVTCMDCLKDFSLDTYARHQECITEQQKYGANPNPTAGVALTKGKAKQSEWTNKIKMLIQTNSYPKDVKSLLTSLIRYDNVPRKKQKFNNFIKNSFRIRNDGLIEKVWNIFECSIKNGSGGNDNDSTKPPSGHRTQSSRGLSVPNEDNDNHAGTVADKSGKKTMMDNIQRKQDKIKMKRVINDILQRSSAKESYPLGKLRKKVLKIYRQQGFNDDQATLAKFQSVIAKKFIIQCNSVTLS